MGHRKTVEKLLKTLLAERNADYPKIHSLLQRVHLAGAHQYELSEFVQELVALNR